ncbi:MAG: hypothetical protein ACREQN_02065 [Candidatus Binataceae bacterium]
MAGLEILDTSGVKLVRGCLYDSPFDTHPKGLSAFGNCDAKHGLDALSKPYARFANLSNVSETNLNEGRSRWPVGQARGTRDNSWRAREQPRSCPRDFAEVKEESARRCQAPLLPRLMPNFFMRLRKVLGFKSRKSAAPLGPSIRLSSATI